MELGKGILSFGGKKIPKALIFDKIEYDLMPDVTITTKDLPMDDGQIFVAKKYGIRTVKATGTFIGSNKENLLKEAATTLVSWLNHDKPQDLILRDLPDRVFQAVLSSSVPIDRIEHLGQITLTFTMYKPHGRSLEPKIYPLKKDTTLVINEGTAEAFPIISFKLKKDTTYFFITGAEQTLFFGEPHDPTVTTVFDPEPTIFNDECSDITPWSQATGMNVDGGKVLGTMFSNGYSFQQENKDYGTLLNKWHGGAIVRSLKKQVQDFELNATIGFFSRYGYEKGRIEIYLLDINDRILGKMSLKDIDYAMDNPIFDCFMGQVGNGGKNLSNTWGDYKGVWKQFNGIIKIGRRGKTWFCYAGKINQKDWTQDARYYRPMTDTAGAFQGKVAKIMLHIGAYSDSAPVTSMWINRVWLKEYVTEQENTVDYVGKAGDEFAINCETGEIFRNGQYIGVQYAGSEFIRFKPGEQGITFSDPDLIEEGTLTFTERWV